MRETKAVVLGSSEVWELACWGREGQRLAGVASWRWPWANPRRRQAGRAARGSPLQALQARGEFFFILPLSPRNCKNGLLSILFANVAPSQARKLPSALMDRGSSAIREHQ